MIDTKSLQVFVAVAEELHFGRAAERLHLAQPPVSQRIRALERQLRVQLFERTTRSVRLTDAGEALLDHSRRILASIEEAETVCRAAGTGAVGKVRIGFAGASSHDDLPRLTRAVRRSYPGIELELHGQTYAEEASARVASGELDLGFARLPIEAPGLDYRVVNTEQLLCALPTQHPAARSKTIDLAALADEPFVTFPAYRGSSLRAVTIHACAEAGFTPRIVQEAPDSATILALVAAGVGVTLTLSSVRHVQRTGVAYRPVRGQVEDLQAVLVWRADNPSKALRRVLDVAADALPGIASD